MENQELNIEKILEVTNKYFKGNKEVNLTDLQMELLRNVAEYDDATNNLIKWLNDAIENDEERSIENYLAEVTNVYEMMLSEKEARKFEQDLKRINPDVDIKLDKNCTSIDISKSVKELKLPENFYLDENNCITNKENTALSVFVSLKVNEIKKNNKNVEGENNMDNEERKEEIIIDNDFLKKEPKKRKKSKFRKFKKFILTVGTKIFKVSRYITNKFVSIKDYLEEEMTINVTKDNNIKDTNDKTTKQTPQNIKKCFTEISNSMSSNENVDSINKQMDTLFHQITHEKDDITRRKLSDKYFDLSNRLEILKQQLKEEQSLKNDKIDDSISLNEKIDNINKRMDTLFHQITHEKDDITRRKLSDKYFDLSNQLDAINIKLNLLKQKREEIVAENPMIHARTM